MPPPAHGLASRLIAGPTLRTQSDRRLVRLVREGYESAFEEIVRRYGRALGRYAAAIVGNRSEDVTQDAFSRALIAMRRDDAEIELRPWLYRIVRNAALNDLRDRPAAAAELAEAIATGASAEEAIEQREELTDLMARLQALPEAQRVAIVMRELEGLSHDEIAAALGMSGGGARQAIYRARKALRDGAGMLVPLPLLRALLGPEGSAAAEAAGGAVGLAGAGLAVKATAATVLVAGTVGAGVALQETTQGPDGREGPARAAASGRSGDDVGATAAPVTTAAGDSSGPSSNSGPGGGGDDGSGPGRDDREDDDDSSGRSGGDSERAGEDRSGQSRRGSSGSGHDDSGEEENDEDDGGVSGHRGPGDGFDDEGGDEDRSGSGSGSLSGSNSGSLSSGSSGSGSADYGADDPTESDNSDSSGSSGSESSGSGSGSADDFESFDDAD